MKKYNNITSFLIPFTLSIFSSIILLPNRSSGAHYQYEACGPTNCGKGPNISFPFYVPGRQESYCGYPGFALQCSDGGFPLLRLPGNDYAVEQFFYRDRSFRVYDAAVLTSGSSSCVPSIRNTTLPSARFDYVNVTGLYLFSGCEKPLSEDLSRYDIGCGSGGGWDLAMDGEDGNLGYAVGICERNVVVPVEGGGYGEGRNGILNIWKVLRKGFALRWKASNCSECEDSGGRCGFDVGNYHFRCFCPDRPHSRSCKPVRMSDNGSVPSPPMKDSDHLFGPSEIGPKFAYEAGIRRKIISNNDMFPEWAGHVRRLRACELEEGGSLCNHILEMMNYMNKLEYLDTNFDRNLAVPLLLRSLPDSYNDFLWKNHCENKSKTWIEIINELRRYEEDKITQKGKLEEEKGKEKRKEKHYALDAQVGSSKRRKSCSWRDLGNGERKCPKNIEESIGSSS
ncbi:hypothetical protein OROHE_002191 [Orobanche hederae]